MNERPLFIILVPGFAASESDTTCLPFQQKTVMSLKEVQPDMEVIVLAFQYPYTKKEYNWNGTRIIPFNGRNRGGLSRLLLRARVAVRLNTLRKQRKILGLLSFFCGECAITGKRFAQRYGLKHYCWICGQDAKKENPYPARMKGSPKDFIALSDFLQDQFDISHGIRPYYVIPPGIDQRDFNSNVNSKDIDLLAAGSLIPLKRFEIFIGIVEKLKQQYPQIKTVLVGDGPEKQKLEEKVKKHGLGSNITLTGELPHAQLLSLMKRTKVLLHPSAYEGFGVVCLEALYAGASVISFTKPMNDPIPNWYYIPDKESMIEKAIQLLQAEKTEMVAPDFSIEKTVKSLMKLY